MSERNIRLMDESSQMLTTNMDSMTSVTLVLIECFAYSGKVIRAPAVIGGEGSGLPGFLLWQRNPQAAIAHRGISISCRDKPPCTPSIGRGFSSGSWSTTVQSSFIAST
jgi:hypothetical protein